MARKQDQRSEETKQSILSSAERLFASRGYEAVTMREIAKEAGCSHTTIYIYFKDKEALLHLMSMPSLQAFDQEMEEVLQREDLSPDQKLIELSLRFIRFCLVHRNMYTIIFYAKAGRVDDAAPPLETNRVRNQLFAKLMGAVGASLQLTGAGEEARLLPYARIYFYALQGMVANYVQSEESAEGLMDRLTDTFREGIRVVLLGCRASMNELSAVSPVSPVSAEVRQPL